MARKRGQYTWDAASHRYRAANGRFVTQDAVRQALDSAVAKAGRRARSLGEALRKKEISLSAWRQEMRLIIKDVHLYSAAAARGGWAQMDASTYGRVGQIIRVQYQYLDRFVQQLANGLLLDGRFTRRLAMYTEAGRGTYHTVLELAMIAQGKTEERNILGRADHCGECPQISALGWVPIGTLPIVGFRECVTSCKCMIHYR